MQCEKKHKTKLFLWKLFLNIMLHILYYLLYINILFFTVRIVSIGHKIILRKHEDVTLSCEYGISVESKHRKNANENQRSRLENNLKRKWYKGSRELSSKMERYLIQNVQEEDSGNYSCMVFSTDKIYKDIITYQLIVVGRIDNI